MFLAVDKPEAAADPDAEPLRSPDAIRDFRAGRKTCLERVYWTYVGLVERVVRQCLRRSGRGEAEAADVVQEVFIKAFGEGGRNAYDGIRPYGPFIATLSRNVTIDFVRARGREPALRVSELEGLADTGVIPS